MNALRLPVELPDEALVSRVARGDVNAFEVLYDWYARSVYALASYLLGSQAAEEAVQEVFLRLWHRAGQFDPARGVFAVWFTAIARHHIRAELRRRGRERQLTAASEVEAVLAAVQDPEPGVDDIVWSKDCAAAVRKTMRELPPDQRQAVVMNYKDSTRDGEVTRGAGGRRPARPADRERSLNGQTSIAQRRARQMNCAQVQELIDLYALGALDDAEAADVAAHLDTCQECRQQLERAELAVAHMPMALAAASPLHPPSGLKGRVLASASRVDRLPVRRLCLSLSNRPNDCQQFGRCRCGLTGVPLPPPLRSSC